MKRLISDLKQHWKDRPFIWGEFKDWMTEKVHLPTRGKVLVLGPHPDDPEGIAITCRLLRNSGCDIWYTIACMSPSGVEDEYAEKWGEYGLTSLKDKKIEIRQREQILATEMFGLTRDRLAFLKIEEKKDLNSPENLTKIRNHLDSIGPDIVIMPVGKDRNQTHAWVYQVFRDYAKDLARRKEKPILGLYNEDPKTIEIRNDLFVLFNEESAEWKRALLRAHDSQQQRNIHSHGMGFDERILRINRSSYRRLQEMSPPLKLPAKYAEAFEIELFDFPDQGAKE